MMFANKSFAQRNYEILKLDFTNLWVTLIAFLNRLILLNLFCNFYLPKLRRRINSRVYWC